MSDQEQRYNPYKRSESGLFIPEHLLTPPPAALAPTAQAMPQGAQAGRAPAQQAPQLSRQQRRNLMRKFAGQQVNNLFAKKQKKVNLRKAILPQVCDNLPTEEFKIPQVSSPLECRCDCVSCVTGDHQRCYYWPQELCCPFPRTNGAQP